MTERSKSENTPHAENHSAKPKWNCPRWLCWCNQKFHWIIDGLNGASPTLTAIATVFIGLVAFLQWQTFEKTDATLKIQQRAWLTPLGANIAPGDLKENEPIRYGIVFANSGREPALGVNFHIQSRTIESYDPKNTDISTITVPENTACKGLLPQRGRVVIGPTPAQTGSAMNYSSAHGEPYFVADDKLVRGDRFYVVNGCAAYETQGSQKHTSFCYILESQLADVPIIINNVATQTTQRKRVWYFVNCATGFDEE